MRHLRSVLAGLRAGRVAGRGPGHCWIVGGGGSSGGVRGGSRGGGGGGGSSGGVGGSCGGDLIDLI